jgi:hypothetical protein
MTWKHHLSIICRVSTKMRSISLRSAYSTVVDLHIQQLWNLNLSILIIALYVQNVMIEGLNLVRSSDFPPFQ